MPEPTSKRAEKRYTEFEVSIRSEPHAQRSGHDHCRVCLYQHCTSVADPCFLCDGHSAFEETVTEGGEPQ